MITNYIFLRQSNHYFVCNYKTLNEYKSWERFIPLSNLKFILPKRIIGEIKIGERI